MRMCGGGGGRQSRGNGRRDRGHMRIPNEIRATHVDHVLNYGLTMANQRVKPNVERTTVSSIIRTFCRQKRDVI